MKGFINEFFLKRRFGMLLHSCNTTNANLIRIQDFVNLPVEAYLRELEKEIKVLEVTEDHLYHTLFE
jgi:hypothetical protein